jgi:hypothetical protein
LGGDKEGRSDTRKKLIRLIIFERKLLTLNGSYFLLIPGVSCTFCLFSFQKCDDINKHNKNLEVLISRTLKVDIVNVLIFLMNR